MPIDTQCEQIPPAESPLRPFGIDAMATSPTVTDDDILYCILSLDSGCSLDDASGGMDDW
ncbi:hypothetical protein [Aestuariimicrobium sp. T2.26MG-19.2B]|uniref:hypothetical protein n=1 Tax=Aestuariimicrobium sp. T2.26MG-19.2B TaxID=3040679 RepID=UPI0024779DD4|nr:hypothetical protein [Aestuariimicrobium sp. T2.26MG-19.2B]CAI9411740.1 hypothetical protein AESSP_02711 [Aestuariimicrobium sp. T2.26MG-19.2B]